MKHYSLIDGIGIIDGMVDKNVDLCMGTYPNILRGLWAIDFRKDCSL